MLGEVKSAPEATEIARNFLRKYRMVVIPLKAVREGDAWLVEVDVGAVLKTIAKVKIDAKSGDILEYYIP